MRSFIFSFIRRRYSWLVSAALVCLTISQSGQAFYYPDIYNYYPSISQGQVLGAATTQGLVGYWNFDEGSGAMATDGSGNGYNGTVTGATWVTGKIGSGALNFDGSGNDTVKVSPFPALPAITIATWIKVPDFNVIRRVFDRNSASPIIRVLSTGGVQLVGSAFLNGGNLTANTWHHIAATADSSGEHIYVDGTLVASDSVAYTVTSTGPLVIGGSINPFLGQLDDFYVYNRALSAQEISDLYALGGGTPPALTPTPTPSPTSTPVSTSTPVVSPIPTPTPTGATYTVKQDGTGNFTTIQACANAVQAGQTCLVYAGIYPEHVKTVSGGTSDTNRVTFQAQGTVTMQGFDIKNQYVTVNGFDIANYGQQWSFNVQVFSGGSFCNITDNTIRDDATSGGIGFVETNGAYANNCDIAGNTLKNLGYTFLSISGAYHTFENNILSHVNSRDYMYVFGHDSVFKNNQFLDGNTIAGVGNHPDWVQTFGNNGEASYNMLFEHNWIQNLDTQLGQLNSQTDLTPAAPAQLSALVHDWTFENNVILNVSDNMNVAVPGVTFLNNTFYHMANQLSGIGFGGSLKRGDASRALLENNAFVAGGALPDPYGYVGYYTDSGAQLSKEVLYPLSSDQTVGTNIFSNLVANSYIDSNGNPLAKAKALTDISQFVLDNTYASYKPAVYDLLTRTVQLDASIRNTFTADYNFVSEDAPTFSPKATHCGVLQYQGVNFCEVHGINGGDPKFQNLSNPLGPDGIPFTLDDGLKPLPTSPLCGKGSDGTDIGAYSCDPTIVLASAPAPTFTRPAPTSTPTPIPTPAPVISNLIGSNTTASTTQIRWNTDQQTVGQVLFGPITAYGFSSPADTLSTAHSFLLSGLSPATLYHFKVTAVNSTGQSSQSSDFAFTTLAAPTSTPTPPPASGPAPAPASSPTPAPVPMPMPTPTAAAIAPAGGGGTLNQSPSNGSGSGSLVGSSSPVTVYIPATVSPASGLTVPSFAVPIKLINDHGTFYLIQNGVRHGIANPGLLTSYGFSFSQAQPASSADLALPQGDLLAPSDGVLAKTAADKTVYLISNGQRHGFTSEKVFTAQGYQFSQVLTITAPELNKLIIGSNIDNGLAAHSPGVDIVDHGTIYWIDGSGMRHAYPSIKVFNSWHVQNDFSRVLSANAADRNLPVGDVVGERVID